MFTVTAKSLGMIFWREKGGKKCPDDAFIVIAFDVNYMVPFISLENLNNFLFERAQSVQYLNRIHK